MSRESDIKKHKAECAAKAVMKRCPWVKINYEHEYIQKFGADFYSQFMIIICGLDNVEARRWINAMVHSLVKFDKDNNPEVNTFLIDGGTEGF